MSLLKIKAIITEWGDKTEARAAAAEAHIPVIELIPQRMNAGRFELGPAGILMDNDAEFAVSSDTCQVMITSGTTATPKIVPVLQKQHFLAKQRQMQRLNITCTDRCLHIVPYYHGMGLGTPLIGILLAGGTVICTKDFIPQDFFPLLKEYRPTYYIASPALHLGILREIRKLPADTLKNNALRYILSSSASLPPAVCREMETLLGVPVIENFASSETISISINYPPKQGSVGIPVVDHLGIFDENERALGSCIPGEIRVKGVTIFEGYENAPLENSKAFIDGWFRTGDLGYIDSDGYLFLTGRRKEQINKGGRKIAPAEIDAALASHQGVEDAMVFGMPDPVLGEDVAAMVVLVDKNVTEADLRTVSS